MFSSPKVLAVYSGVLTVAFAVVVLCGAAIVRKQEFWRDHGPAHQHCGTGWHGAPDHFESRRLPRCVEPREGISPARSPEAAGMLFMSEEGTELGGLIWGAGQLPDGSIQNHAHLSFDEYEQNQIFAIDAGQEGNDKFFPHQHRRSGRLSHRREAEGGTTRSKSSRPRNGTPPGRSSSPRTGMTCNGWFSDGRRMARSGIKLLDNQGKCENHVNRAKRWRTGFGFS